MNHRVIPALLPVAFLTALACAASAIRSEGFAPHPAPSLDAVKVAHLECRYFTELLGVWSQAQIDRQLEPIAHTDVDTVVCCPMGWRFYNFPSAVDPTWREPAKFPRNASLFPHWRKMVDNLAAGGDPLRDALQSTRRLKKSFIVSFRMNDNHYLQVEDFPTHNNLWRAHPEYRLGNDSQPYSLSRSGRVFNYMIPEVRDFYFGVLEEICSNYDVDGLELDFQRAPRFFHDEEIEKGRAVMTAHVHRIRTMLDQIGARRGQHLRLDVRVLHTIDANFKIGVDVPAWDAAGWLDGIIVSPSYIQTADVGIEGFCARPHRARIYGELNFVHLQLAGTGHNPQERRYVTPETYRAATLSYLERGADGVSFFNTYCLPQPELGRLTANLLAHFKDLPGLKRSDKNYTSYATRSTIFGQIFPARNRTSFQMYIADAVPGTCERAALRFETRPSCATLHIAASINGRQLDAYDSGTAELFPPVAVNAASPKRENVRFFAVPISALKFGVNQIKVENLDASTAPCDFVSAELGLYMKK